MTADLSATIDEQLWRSEVSHRLRERLVQERMEQVRRDQAERWARYRAWAKSFAGRPNDFIAEVMPEWLSPDWAAWRVFVATVFGQPLTVEELETFRLCTGLETYEPGRCYREVWCPVGRRGGKSRTLGMVAVYLACCFDYHRYLAPGEQGFITVLSDQREHAKQIMNYVKGALRHPRLTSLVKRSLAETVELAHRVVIQVVTASINAVRSRTTIAALCDEIAFWPTDEDSANPDEEILSGLRPSMVTIPGSLLLAASSRYARRGALWHAFRDSYAKDEGPLVWSASTTTMHPGVDRAFLATEYERDPVSAEAEYGLGWRTDVAAFVEPATVAACVQEGLTERPPARHFSYVAFVDAAGGSGADSMTLAIAHAEGERGVLDALREFRPPFVPADVVAEFAALLRSYRVSRLRGDRYGGDWVTTAFSGAGFSYEPSDLSKSDIYREFLPLLNGTRVDLLDVRRLTLQLTGLERRTARGGRDSVDHPPRGHDDVANVAAGALVMVTGEDQPLVISAEALRLAGMPSLH